MDNIITATYAYKTVSNCPIHLDAYVNPDRNSPVLVHIHGGALIWGSRKEISPVQLALYLEAGFSVVSIDYRLAPETKLPEIAQDISDALTWVRSEFRKIYGINPGK
jgi:acetyl esterase/lipase